MNDYQKIVQGLNAKHQEIFITEFLEVLKIHCRNLQSSGRSGADRGRGGCFPSERQAERGRTVVFNGRGDPVFGFYPYL